MIMVHEPGSDLNRQKEGIMTKFISILLMKKLFFKLPKKYGEAFHETLSPMSFGSLAKRWTNQNSVTFRNLWNCAGIVAILAKLN